MPEPKKKEDSGKFEKSRNRTGEDIDMLNESKTDPQDDYWGSSSYKDDIDGA